MSLSSKLRIFIQKLNMPLTHYWKPRMWFYATSALKITVYIRQYKLQQYYHLLNTFYKDQMFHIPLFQICGLSMKVLANMKNWVICITINRIFPRSTSHIKGFLTSFYRSRHLLLFCIWNMLRNICIAH